MDPADKLMRSSLLVGAVAAVSAVAAESTAVPESVREAANKYITRARRSKRRYAFSLLTCLREEDPARSAPLFASMIRI